MFLLKDTCSLGLYIFVFLLLFLFYECDFVKRSIFPVIKFTVDNSCINKDTDDSEVFRMFGVTLTQYFLK